MGRGVGVVQVSAPFPIAEWLSSAAPLISEDFPVRKALARLRWGWNASGDEGWGKGENRWSMLDPSPSRRRPLSLALSYLFLLLSLVFSPHQQIGGQGRPVRSETPRERYPNQLRSIYLSDVLVLLHKIQDAQFNLNFR